MFNNYYMENIYRPFNNPNNIRQNNMNLYNPKVGYDYGNMFSNLYEGFENYKPTTLTGRNEKEDKLLEISRIAFACHDLKLFLDLNPNDTTMVTLYNDYKNKYKTSVDEYERKYGVLSNESNALDKLPFRWVNEGWPWEEDNYV